MSSFSSFSLPNHFSLQIFHTRNPTNTKKKMKARISIMSFNVWGDFYLSERSKNLQNVLLTVDSDIILLQEVSSNNLQIITNSLPSHNCIQDWQSESNILWRDSLFNLVNSGYQSFNHSDYPSRGLFWVRLSLKCQPNYEFIVSTSHLPWAGSTSEVTTGVNQRIQCCGLVLEYLDNISKPNEPIVFGGDLNDDFHPLRVLRGEDNSTPSNEEKTIRLYDVFELLDLPPVITHPVRPSDSREEMRPSRTIDYIMINTPPQDTSSPQSQPELESESQPSLFFKPIAAFVKGIRGNWPPPSDHLPVVAVLEIVDRSAATQSK